MATFQEELEQLLAVKQGKYVPLAGTSTTGRMSYNDLKISEGDPKKRRAIESYYARVREEEEKKKKRLEKGAIEDQKRKEERDYQNSLQGKAATLGKGVINETKDMFKRVGEGTAESIAFNRGEVADARQDEARTIARNTELLQKVNQQLRDPKTPKEKKARLQKVAVMLNEQTQELTGGQRKRLGETIEKTDPVKGGAAVVGLGLLSTGGVAGRAAGIGQGTKLGAMTAGQVGRASAVGATEGAIGGATATLQGDDVGALDVVKGAGIGAVIGGAIPVIGHGLGRGKAQRAAAYQARLEEAALRDIPVEAITDNSRLLPAVTASRKTQLATKIDDINNRIGGLQDEVGTTFEKAPVVASKADDLGSTRVATADIPTTKAGTPDARTRASRTTGTFTPEDTVPKGITGKQIRALKQQRDQLTKELQDIEQGNLALAVTDDAIQETTSKGEKAIFNKQKTLLQDQTKLDAGNRAVADQMQVTNEIPLKPSTQALKTQAVAVKEGISEEIGDIAQYPPGTHEQWTSRVLATIDQDYDQAKRIALGQANPTDNTPVNAFYRGVEQKAIREGDSKLIADLANSPVSSRTSKAAQELNALGIKNPDSPLDSMKVIINARKKGGRLVPKGIGQREAERITELSKNVAKAREVVAGGGDRMVYGRASVEMTDYVSQLVEDAGRKSIKESLKQPGNLIVKGAGVTKSMRATLDNSALFRQGWKTLFTHPGVWAKNSAKSFSDFFKAAGDVDALKYVHQDVVSRPNSMNGMYKKLGIDVFGVTEEAFPSDFPSKIPLFRRLHNASDAAYTGFLQRTRADLADIYIDTAMKSGVDMTSKTQLQSIGKLVNSLTSRGHLGKLESSAEVLNNVFFSPRLLKSNIDVLTAHQFQKGVTPFVRKRAAINMAKIVAGSAAILKVADEVAPGSVEWDPRSANFGKIQVGDTRFDVAGGMAGLYTLASRVGPAFLPGIDPASKSSTTGVVNKLNSGEFGSRSTFDVGLDFFQNKFSPAMGVIRDQLKGEDFDGNKPTPASIAENLLLPLIITNYNETKDNPRSANLLFSMLTEGVGISTSTYSINTDWSQSEGKTVKQFKSKVGQKNFEKANDTYNRRFNDWYDQTRINSGFEKLSMEERKNLIRDKRSELQEDVMAGYGFEYKYESKDEATKRLIEDLKSIGN